MDPAVTRFAGDSPMFRVALRRVLVADLAFGFAVLIAYVADKVWWGYSLREQFVDPIGWPLFIGLYVAPVGVFLIVLVWFLTRRRTPQ